MSLVWQTTPEQALGDLAEAYVSAIRAGVLAIAERRAPEIQAWMQANHLWENITGVAEASLAAEVFQMGADMVEIYMSQGAYYGLFLEVSNGGKYSILTPAFDTWGPIVWGDVLRMMRR